VSIGLFFSISSSKIKIIIRIIIFLFQIFSNTHIDNKKTMVEVQDIEMKDVTSKDADTLTFEG